MLHEAFYLFSAQRIYGLKKMVVESFQDGCLAHAHLC